MTNRIAEVAKTLNVEWNYKENRSEHFQCTERKDNLFYFDINGDVRHKGGHSSLLTIMDFILGKATISNDKAYAEPVFCKKGQPYKYVNTDGSIVHEVFECHTIDFCLRKSGNMFNVVDYLPPEQIRDILDEMKSPGLWIE